jgi:hypothetical protein
MKNCRLILLVLLSLVIVCSCTASGDRTSPERAAQTIQAARAYASVEFLTSPRCAGRLTGTAGYETAAKWAADEFKKAGLKPTPGEKDFLRPFPMTLYGVESASLALLPANGAGGDPVQAVLGKDFMAMWASDTCHAEAEAVFAGFGITAPDKGRDDYAGIDATGKVAMVLRGAPEDGKSWKGHNDTPARAANARAHGAVAMLLVDQAVLSVHAGRAQGLGMAMVGEEFADTVLAGVKAKVAELRKVLSMGGTASFPTGRKVRFLVEARPEKPATGHNVVAYLPGRDARLKRHYLLICGHLDHIGDWPALNPGANDNASGAAAVIEMARAAASLNPAPKRSIVFALLGGEEMGLLGAKHLSRNLPEAPDGLGGCEGVFNLDMVGQGTGAYVAGGTNFPGLFKALETARDVTAPGLKLVGGGSSGEARADHGPFQEVGIPAVSLFGAWGVSHGYHTPEDTLYWLTPKTTESLARIVFLAAVAEADR